MAPRSHLWHTQNFIRRSGLVDHLLDRAGITADDVVYDLGAGRGAITARLAPRCRRVIAIEKDPLLCAVLRKRFPSDAAVVIRCGDLMQQSLPRRPYKVFANPPFDLTSTLITKLTEAPVPPDDMHLAIQKEAADRYIGQPRMTLSALLLAPFFTASIVHTFRRGDFVPTPAVDVVMLRLRKRGPPLIAAHDRRLYRDLMTDCFTAWKPSVGAALAHLFGRRLATGLLVASGIDPDARPSRTHAREWLDLFQAFREIGDGDAFRRIAGAERRLENQRSRLHKPTRTPVADRQGKARLHRSTIPTDERGPPRLTLCCCSARRSA